MTLDEFRNLISVTYGTEDLATSARFFQLYIKSYGDNAKEFVAQHGPAPGEVNLLQIIENDVSAIGKARKWCDSEKVPVHESIIGPCVSPADSEKLSSFLQNAIPIQPEYKSCEMNYRRASSIPEFYRFVQSIRADTKNVYKTRYHPYCTDLYYWLGDKSELLALIVEWLQLLNSECAAPKGYYSLNEAAQSLHVKQEVLLRWVKTHQSDACILSDTAYLRISMVHHYAKWWNTISLLNDLLSIIASEYPKVVQPQVISTAEDTALSSKYLLPDQLIPQMIPGIKYYEKRYEKKLRSTIYAALKDVPCVNTIRLNYENLNALIANGMIPGLQCGNTFFVSRQVEKKLKRISDKYEAIDEIVRRNLHPESLFNLEVSQDRKALVEFIENNNYWDIQHFKGDELDYPVLSSVFDVFLFREDENKFMSHINLWLQGYKKDDVEKIRVLIGHYRDAFPSTCSLISSFFFNAKLTRPVDKADIDMVDMLFSLLDCELQDMSRDDVIQKIVKPFNDTSRVCGKRLSAFLDSCSMYGISNIGFPTTGYHPEIKAYSINSFSIIVAHIVLPEIWQSMDLITKAIANETFASLWLFVSLHCFAAWRITDYIRLQAPRLQRNPDVVLNEIATGFFPQTDAEWLAREFVSQIDILGMTPHKTENCDRISKLFFSIPESCLGEFGLVLAIAAAHFYKSGKVTFISTTVNTADNIQSFFGNSFFEACGNKAFSTRRANKTLLQCVEVVAREDLHLDSRIAYHLASIVRSHKGTLQDLSKTTEIYLRDSEFFGLSPDYIIYQMNERGVCSFITDTLMKRCYGDDYMKLPLAAKTEVFKELGLIPYQMDQLRLLAENAMVKATDLIGSMISSDRDAELAVLNIAIGECQCKSGQQYCICTALGIDCQEPSRQSGLGCPYEVLTKASLIQYLSEYNRLGAVGSNLTGTEFDRQRALYLRDTIVKPKIAEYMNSLKRVTNQEDIEPYKRLGRGMISYAKRNGEQLLQNNH